MSDSATIARPETGTEEQVKILPPYNVVLANDDHHSGEFVVGVLVKVFGYKLERCMQLMLEAHTKGRAIVWSGAKEVGELKVEQMNGCREKRGAQDLGPLTVSLEPAPG